MYILGPQRDADPGSGSVLLAFDRYLAHLRENRSSFSRSLFDVATSDWYYDFTDPRCPHDARLTHLGVDEAVGDEDTGARQVLISIRLQSYFYDDLVEFSFHYPDVFSYRFESSHRCLAERAWRYDEFRLSDDGGIIHEIEWAGTGNWTIECSDVEFKWRKQPAGRGTGTAADDR